MKLWYFNADYVEHIRKRAIQLLLAITSPINTVWMSLPYFVSMLYFVDFLYRKLSIRLSNRASSLGPSPLSATKFTLGFQKFHTHELLSELIFHRVLHVILEPLRANQNVKGYGTIYIVQKPEYKDYVKIGYTRHSINAGMRSMKAIYGRGVFELIGFETVVCYQRLERIIFAELWNERCFWLEPSEGRRHTEWFKIDAQEAVERLRQWASWMRQKPYEPPGSDKDGNLKPDFARRLDYLRRNMQSDDPIAQRQKLLRPLHMLSGPERGE